MHRFDYSAEIGHKEIGIFIIDKNTDVLEYGKAYESFSDARFSTAGDPVADMPIYDRRKK